MFLSPTYQLYFYFPCSGYAPFPLINILLFSHNRLTSFGIIPFISEISWFLHNCNVINTYAIHLYFCNYGSLLATNLIYATYTGTPYDVTFSPFLRFDFICFNGFFTMAAFFASDTSFTSHAVAMPTSLL